MGLLLAGVEDFVWESRALEHAKVRYCVREKITVVFISYGAHVG